MAQELAETAPRHHARRSRCAPTLTGHRQAYYFRTTPRFSTAASDYAF
jgi:hypothetical protein